MPRAYTWTPIKSKFTFRFIDIAAYDTRNLLGVDTAFRQHLLDMAPEKEQFNVNN